MYEDFLINITIKGQWKVVRFKINYKSAYISRKRLYIFKHILLKLISFSFRWIIYFNSYVQVSHQDIKEPRPGNTKQGFTKKSKIPASWVLCPGIWRAARLSPDTERLTKIWKRTCRSVRLIWIIAFYVLCIRIFL